MKIENVMVCKWPDNEWLDVDPIKIDWEKIPKKVEGILPNIMIGLFQGCKIILEIESEYMKPYQLMHVDYFDKSWIESSNMIFELKKYAETEYDANMADKIRWLLYLAYSITVLGMPFGDLFQPDLDEKYKIIIDNGQRWCLVGGSTNRKNQEAIEIDSVATIITDGAAIIDQLLKYSSLLIWRPK